MFNSSHRINALGPLCLAMFSLLKSDTLRNREIRKKSNVELFCKRTNCGEVMATGLRMEAAIFQIVAIFPDFEIVGWAGLHKIAPL